jgi:hypothetical protein
MHLIEMLFQVGELWFISCEYFFFVHLFYIANFNVLLGRKTK